MARGPGGPGGGSSLAPNEASSGLVVMLCYKFVYRRSQLLAPLASLVLVRPRMLAVAPDCMVPETRASE